MIKAFFLVPAFFVAFLSCAQTAGKAKLYGFKEAVVSGKSPGSEVEENSRETPRMDAGATGFNYFIYISSPVRIYPSEIWLNGKPYGVSMETVTELPVTRENENVPGGKRTVLVPQTTDKVLLLTPVNAVTDKLSAKGKSLAANNELVVVYKQGGSFYYVSRKIMTALEPVALQ